MECLTSLAVDGLRRLIKQGDFTRPGSVAEAIADYESREQPDPENFLEEYGNIDGKPRNGFTMILLLVRQKRPQKQAYPQAVHKGCQ